MPRRRGAKWERKYRNELNEFDGFTAIRLPSSGSAIDADLPDLHAWFVDDDRVDQFTFEVKAFKDANRLENAEIDALRRFAVATGAEPRVLAHVKHDGGYVLQIDELHSTDKGFTLRKTRDFEGARTFDDFVRNVQADVVD